MMTRRDVLKMIGAGMLGLYYPWQWPKAFAKENVPGRILVLLELKGGNDGLNTVVPYSDAGYYKLRPGLAVRRDQVLQVSETLGFNPRLGALMDIWQQKELAIINGVGYPQPNRSHFRSIEIWQTGSSSSEYLQAGWLARLMAGRSISSNAVADGAAIGGNAGPLAGGDLNVVVMRNADRFFHQARRVAEVKATTDNPALKHLLTVQNDLHRSAQALSRKVNAGGPLKTEFPKTPIGRNFETAARLIASDTGIPIINVSHGGFDTHANQRANHDRILWQLAEATAAFRLAMQETGWWDRVLVMTYSEFGRRPAENNSRGTDHGTAAPHFVLGGKVKGGIYGNQPSLADLEKGDLKFNIDFRRLYATVARNWWGLNNKFLGGGPYATINFV